MEIAKTPMRKLTVLLLLLSIAPFPSAAQTQLSTRRVRFTTHEGSFLAFDISRDGRWIVMDLLGDLWKLPVRGGDARRITDVVRDSAEFLDPTFTSDGNAILAHGEFRGQQGVFLLTGSQGNVHWIAPDTVRIHGGPSLLQSPSWGADAKHILLARRISDTNVVLLDRDIGSGEERRIDVQGVTGVGRHGPVYSADHLEIFFNTTNGYSGVPPAGRIWRVSSSGGPALALTPVGLNALAAAPSPDGRRIAYFAIDSTGGAQVYLQNLTDTVGVRLTNDHEITPTRIRWLPGGESFVYVESGRLWRLDVATRVRREIPFSATVNFVRTSPLRSPVRFPSPGDRMVARGAFPFAMAPDGRAFALIALNRLWIAGADSGSPASELVRVPATAASPDWSPDGSHIAWTAGTFGSEDLFVTDTVTRRTRRIVSLPGTRRAPVWSPDGRFILIRQLTLDPARTVARLRAIRMHNAVADSLEETVDLGNVVPNIYVEGFEEKPQWSPRSDAVLVLGPLGNRRERPASLRFLDASPMRPVRGLPSGATSVQWLPGDTLAFLMAGRLWRAAFSVADGIVGPATPISDEPAAYLEASRSGDLLYYSEDGYRVRSHLQSPRHLGWPVRYTVPVPPPLVVRNVRIIDGTGAAGRAPQDILVERGRIVRIASAGTIVTPPGAGVVDGAGRPAIPGMIDLHSHHPWASYWRGQLYFGVTTRRSAGNAPPADGLTAGEWLGPRLAGARGRFETEQWPFTRGASTGIMPEVDPQHLDRVIRLSAGLGSDLIKIHGAGGWATQVRTVVEAHSLGMRVTGHCAYPLTLIAAGIDSKEHLGWQCTAHDVGRWYDDLVQLYARSGVPIIPTVAILSTAEQLRGVNVPVPPEVASLFGGVEQWAIARSLNRRTYTAELANVLDAARKLHRAGVALGAGTDIERPDALQYELEALVEASLTPLEAIAAATSVAARIMGASDDVGRIAPGLFADIVILDADPSIDIRNARRIWRVIQGGRVVDRQLLIAPGWDRVQLPE